MIDEVSIHAPVWGASASGPGCSNTPHFQSTHPCGVRRSAPATESMEATVSIHAPVWGATSLLNLIVIILMSFNPRTRVGCDHRLRVLQVLTQGFNPRTRVGCDANWDIGALQYIVSIHAPVWGATSENKEVRQLFKVSIHAPVWGATPL